MKFFQLIPTTTNFDFVGKIRFFTTLSSLAVAGILVLMFTKGFNFGIDFTGGTVVQTKFSEPTTAQAVREIVDSMGEENASVVALGDEKTEFLITVRTIRKTTDEKPLDKRLVEKLGIDKVEIAQVDIVGPKVGQELKRSAILSLFYSLFIIMIYIWFRFDFKFAPGATIALIHDILFVAGFYLITGREFTIAAVAALLTTAGYSINDTIVIYDRAREMLKTSGSAIALPELLNRAINITLSRTIITQVATALSIIPIAIFCSGDLASFAISMLVGVLVGSYSTIYIAAPSTVLFQRWMKKFAGGGSKKPVLAK